MVISHVSQYRVFALNFQNQKRVGQPYQSPETELQSLAKNTHLDEDGQELKAALELCIHNQRTLVKQLLQHFLKIYGAPLEASEKQMLMRQASRLLATRPLPVTTSSEPRPTPPSRFDF